MGIRREARAIAGERCRPLPEKAPPTFVFGLAAVCPGVLRLHKEVSPIKLKDPVL